MRILTVAVELARTPNREKLLAPALLVGTEGALAAFRRDGHVWGVAEGIVVAAAAAARAGRVRGTVGRIVAVCLELEGALLELLMGEVAWLEPVHAAGADLDYGEREKKGRGEEKRG